LEGSDKLIGAKTKG